jgi:hypothetical protein
MACTDIIVFGLNENTDNLTALPDIEDTDAFDFYVRLQNVLSVKPDITPVLDEGGVRVIYHETTLEIKFLLGDDSDFGPFISDTVDLNTINKTDDFTAKLDAVRRVLTRQGLGLNFGAYPTMFRKIISSNYRDHPNFITGGTTENPVYQQPPISGNVYDNFNGPITKSLTFDKVLCSDKVIANWTVTFRTAENFEDREYNLPGPPKISSELRLDIDEEGYLMVIYAGTIYGETLESIYAARDWLSLEMTPSQFQNPSTLSRDQILAGEGSLYAQVNGFHEKKQFNIDKTGRAAKFSITYTQVKSNSAYPYGIRDIEFEQELESSLFAASPMEGKGFITWKNIINARIKVPHRMPADYGWYVLHLMILQKMRNASIGMPNLANLQKLINIGDGDSPTTTLEPTKDVGTVSKKDTASTRSIPMMFRIKHNNFNRVINVSAGFVTIAPFSEVFTATCFFDRLNNDYQQALNLASSSVYTGQYVPRTVSEQWYDWNISTDPAFGYSPTSEDGIIPSSLANNNRPHRDNAGHEIVNSGHSFNTYKTRDGDHTQQMQKAQLISMVVDPNEEDPAYQARKRYSFPMGRQRYAQSEADIGNEKLTWDSPYPSQGSAEVYARDTFDIHPEHSWIEYEQKYFFHESFPTVQTTTATEFTAEDFSSKEMYDNYVRTVNDEDETVVPSPLPNVRREIRGGNIDAMLASSTPTQYPRRIFAAGNSRVYLQVKGHAMRARYKIPIPSVLSIAGKRAIKIGKHRTMMMPKGTGGDFPTYVAAWEQWYAFDGDLSKDDLLSQIETTGAENIYT